jgi:hypothetical protein
MTVATAVGLIAAVLVSMYLVYALLRGEKL